MAHEIPVTQARSELAELINRVVYGGEHVVLTRHGKPLVALVSAADLERIQAPAPEPEQAIGTVSVVMDALPHHRSEPSRFGLVAEHGSPHEAYPPQ
ncbi:type II toxin-antitoxin system Phd/YefM family antitoxin [Streptomyces sp. TG1A-8]|uniref:type II toxin-antitoxin system Phd/YefM family antitoxin n=1 Tax=Streptomyces sp. TG1A-8 TaxID=3051385 RepID=UPI00265C4980|nr:type II toxin-antitoxin system Phd/YefM family antitoxin [Streptomyces sp. TG1A-8]MDO0930065.1 type II toxin-antitoxin system Phd/YefM family antitoxin [Streptomyces sp. TG1A-8]